MFIFALLNFIPIFFLLKSASKLIACKMRKFECFFLVSFEKLKAKCDENLSHPRFHMKKARSRIPFYKYLSF